jgi:hypothetical protein
MRRKNKSKSKVVEFAATVNLFGGYILPHGDMIDAAVAGPIMAAAIDAAGPEGADYEEDAEVLVTADAQPGEAGRLTGPPENCYPDTPDVVEVVSIVRKDNGKALTDAALEMIPADELAALEESAWEAYRRAVPSARDIEDMRADAAFQRMRDGE